MGPPPRAGCKIGRWLGHRRIAGELSLDARERLGAGRQGSADDAGDRLPVEARQLVEGQRGAAGQSPSARRDDRGRRRDVVRVEPREAALGGFQGAARTGVAIGEHRCSSNAASLAPTSNFSRAHPARAEGALGVHHDSAPGGQ